MLGALLALVVATAPRPEAWTTADTVLQGAFVAAVAVDYLQTRSFLLHDNPAESWEQNPLLGRHPSMTKLTLFCAGGIVAHTAIAYVLPHPWRTLWQLAWIAVEGATIYGNVQTGVRIEW